MGTASFTSDVPQSGEFQCLQFVLQFSNTSTKDSTDHNITLLATTMGDFTFWISLSLSLKTERKA